MLPGIKLFDLTGRTAVITGGSKGLGLAMAEGLASAGAAGMLVSRHGAQAEAAAAAVAPAYGHKALGVAAGGAQADPGDAAAGAAPRRGRRAQHPPQHA